MGVDLTEPLTYFMAGWGLTTTIGNIMESSSESSTIQVAGKILQQAAYASAVFLVQVFDGDDPVLAASITLLTPLLTFGLKKIAHINNLPNFEMFLNGLDKALAIAGKIMGCAIMIFGYNCSLCISSPLSFLFLGLFALNFIIYTKQIFSHFRPHNIQANSQKNGQIDFFKEQTHQIISESPIT